MSQTEELFLLAGTWTLIAIFIARFIPNWPGRIAFLAIAVGLPFWELPYGYYNFQRLCREELDLKVLLVNPREKVATDLKDIADGYRSIRLGTLRDSQFPDTLTDVHGVITKPAAWQVPSVDPLTTGAI